MALQACGQLFVGNTTVSDEQWQSGLPRKCFISPFIATMFSSLKPWLVWPAKESRLQVGFHPSAVKDVNIPQEFSGQGRALIQRVDPKSDYCRCDSANMPARFATDSTFTRKYHNVRGGDLLFG